MSRFTPLRVAEIRPETDDCVAVRLDVLAEQAAAFAWTPGQHLILKAQVGGEELRRTYSICSASPADGLWIAVKRQPQGRFSGHVNADLKVGDVIEAMPPAGRFFVPLEPNAARTHVAIAAGSGITPVLAIVAATLASEPKSRFVLLYGNRTTASIIFREQLEDLKNRYMTRLSLHHVLSAEPQEIPLHDGRIDAAKIDLLCRHIVDPKTVDAWYLCGPAPMIGDVSSALEVQGVERRRIHFEYFTTEGNTPRQRMLGPAVVESVKDAADVTVLVEGRRIDFKLPYNERSLLDAALDAGADLPFACKGGVCCTCRTKLVEGKVAMAANYALEDWELEQGFILACQARPLTDRVVVDYDQV
ncbi:MAG: 1,2-phenylacetyl-CoA epoxidase subunit PaaE [Geminicoccaceae bacterium]